MTGSIRLHVTASLAEGELVKATARQAHYLVHVMRRGLGAELLVFNGRDGEFAARVDAVGRDHADLRVLGRSRVQEPEPDLWLVFCLLKRDPTDLVVQKATELGVAELLPVLTERSNTQRMNAERLNAIAIEAAEQCERLTVPVLHGARRLAAVLADWPSDRGLFAAVERSGTAPMPSTAGPRALLVGPEGGFTSAELDVLRACAFVTPVSLGPRILRAETACIAGLALLQGMDGR